MEKGADRKEEAQRKTTHETQPTQRAKAKVKKRFKEEGSKLVVSAEVSREIWDALEKRVESGEFETRSDIVRAALDRFLRA